MNKKVIIGTFAIVVLIGGLIAIRLTTVPPQTTVTPGPANSEYIVPGLYPNKIVNTSTRQGLAIKQAKADNNVGASGKDVSDHLQLTLVNTTNATMNGLEVYYTLTDTKTGQKEGYDTPLTGGTVAPNSTLDVNFDNGGGNGHYPVNKNGLFFSSKNDINIDVEASAIGFAPQHVTVTKSAGGADKVD